MLMREIESYLAVRRAAGFALVGTERRLRAFARFAAERGEPRVRTATAIAWAAQAASTYQRSRRLHDVRLFVRYARADDARHELPPDQVFGSPTPWRIPHIFSPDEVRQILLEAGRLGPPGTLRPHTYQTLFGLLAACGLRISEALALRLDDVTADGLVIRKTKFRKSRLVPMHPSTEAALRAYLERRRRVAPHLDRVFVSAHGKPLGYTGAHLVFHGVLRSLGLRRRGEPGPRLHDLRHTLAVRVLEECPRTAVSGRALALSTYLGHSRVSHSYWYLHATPQLMSDIADACQARGGQP
jgi:integrase/recombinase XerD